MLDQRAILLLSLLLTTVHSLAVKEDDGTKTIDEDFSDAGDESGPCLEDPEGIDCLARQAIVDLTSLLPRGLISKLRRIFCKVSAIVSTVLPKSFFFWLKSDFLTSLVPLYLYVKMSLGLVSPEVAFLAYTYSELIPGSITGYFASGMICHDY